MKHLAIACLLLVAVALVAQGSQQYWMSTAAVGTPSTCPTPVAGTNVFCSASDGFYMSFSGGAYQKIQIGAPTLPASFTCSVTGTLSGTGNTVTLANCH